MVEVSRWLSDTPHSVGRPLVSDPSVAETSTSQHSALTRDISMPQAGFEPAIPISKRPQSHALHRMATCIDRRPIRAQYWNKPIPGAVTSKAYVCNRLISWYRAFETRWRHVCSSHVFVICYAGIGLCDDLITCCEKYYRLLVSNFVWCRSLQNGVA